MNKTFSASLTDIYEAAPRPGSSSADATARFLGLVARAYAAVDEVPARIEEGVTRLADVLGARADCNATATAIFLTVHVDSDQVTEVIRIHPVGPDFARAVALHRIVARVHRREITASDAAQRLEALLAWHMTPHPVRALLAYALLSLSAGLLLRAQLDELLMVAVAGAVVGGVLQWIGDRDHLAPLAPVALAAVVSAAAFSADRGGFDVRPMPALVASLVILLPGWRLTVAMTELAQGHWTSGAGRFLAAITTLLLLIVGVVVGQQAVAAPARDALTLPSLTSIPAWVRVLSPLAAGIAMTVLFGARRRDAVWITLICVVTSLAAWLGGRSLGPTASAFAGAFTAMAAGTLIARRRNLPYPVLQLPATVLLVPGSIGFLSMGSLVTRNVNAAVQTGFQMVFIAITLSIGAMTAQVALRPLTVRDGHDA